MTISSLHKPVLFKGRDLFILFTVKNTVNALDDTYVHTYTYYMITCRDNFPWSGSRGGEEFMLGGGGFMLGGGVRLLPHPPPYDTLL